MALAALLTYTLHATVWTLVVAAFARSSSWSSRTRCNLWRVAVFAPIATASLAQLLPLGLFAGKAPSAAPAIQVAWVRASAPVVGELAGKHVPWSLLGLVVVLSVLAGFMRWQVLALLLARHLRGRTAVTDARWLERLERLRLRTRLARVRLTQSPRVASPLVLGISEICVPVGLLPLCDAELDSVLAHELAHLERRDGVWFPVVGVAVATLWLQPLCGWAAARFRDSAEQACDDRAIELTRDAPALARVLLQLASGAAVRAPGLLAPAMANAKRALLSRIRRLVDAESSPPRGASQQRLLVMALGLALLGAAGSGLSVRVALARALLPSSAAHAARQASSSSHVRLLEAQQELRHLLATERWLAEQAPEVGSSSQAPVSSGQP